MSTLVVMMFVAYLLLLALALVVWAAVTLRGADDAGGSRAERDDFDDDPVEVVRAASVPAEAGERAVRVERPDAPRPPSWSPPIPAPERVAAGTTGRTTARGVSNDDVRGLRARAPRDPDEKRPAERRQPDRDRTAPARVRPREESGGSRSPEARTPPWRRGGEDEESRTGSAAPDGSDDARRKRGEEAFERFLRAEDRDRR